MNFNDSIYKASTTKYSPENPARLRMIARYIGPSIKLKMMDKTIQDTLFERIGGMAAVNAAVDLFYEKVIADDRISGFFESVNMHGQSGKMKAFLAYAFGAPVTYSGKDMRAAHAHMDLNEDHFNAVAENLIATLEELSVPQELIDEVVSIAASTKDDVLGN